MSQTSFKVDHVCLTVNKSFEEFEASLEKQLGVFDPSAYETLDGESPQAARERLEAMVGSSGFMLFQTSNHGLVLRLAGQSKKAIQYVLGNPLFAVEMTRYAIGAALYAPLRLLIYEPEEGKTTVEYDRPSSLFGQFKSENVDRMAQSLDQKLAALIETARTESRQVAHS